MKTIRMSLALAGMVGAATLFVTPVSLSASSGMGWDEHFYTGESLTVDSSSYQSSAPQGLDPFNSGDGVKIDEFSQAYMGTSQSDASGGGWDTFHAGDGDPLP